MVKVGSKFLKPALSTNKLVCWHSNICPIAFGPMRESYLSNHSQMPTTHLSPEILGEISASVSQDYHKEDVLEAVMLPAHVCKHWRDVALSTPTLWTNIVLRVTDETFKYRASDHLVFRSSAIRTFINFRPASI